MSRFKFHMGNYHAVSSADIELDGITVIAGPNASGKSTVARWLYYISHGLSNYDSIIQAEGINQILDVIERLRVASSLLGSEAESRIRQAYISINSGFRDGTSTFEQVRSNADSTLDLFINLLSSRLNSDKPFRDINRIKSFFRIPREVAVTMDEVVRIIHQKASADIKSAYLDTKAKLENHTIGNLEDVVFSFTDPDLDSVFPPVRMSEEDVCLIENNNFVPPVGLKRAIYIDTQKIGRAIERNSSGFLSKLLFSKNRNVSKDAVLVARMIKDIIGGSVNSEKEDLFGWGQQSLKFNMSNGVSISLRAAATGIISFSYILRLVENGWLTEDTLVIIDEPESHLHPQWVVEYARILIFINKLLGTKFLISSHDPDFVAAIQSIANAEGMKDRVSFYLAKTDSESIGPKVSNVGIPQYHFKNLGFEIGEIFDSFNVALDRIALYGEEPQ